MLQAKYGTLLIYLIKYISYRIHINSKIQSLGDYYNHGIISLNSQDHSLGSWLLSVNLPHLLFLAFTVSKIFTPCGCAASRVFPKKNSSLKIKYHFYKNPLLEMKKQIKISINISKSPAWEDKYVFIALSPFLLKITSFLSSFFPCFL